MAATNLSPAGGMGENVKGGDEAEEKLLEDSRVLIVPPRDSAEGGALAVKSSKKVTLPEDATSGGGRFTIGPVPERDWEMVPPDGQWGWFVLIGATVVNILIPGTIKSFGVLQLEFNSMSKSSASASSGVVALCYFLYSSLGPLSSILSVKWSYRTVTLLGGSFAAVGMILSRWASSVSYLYFSFGALVGAGAGLAFPPTVYIVTSYFVRLRGLANGICMSGSAFGSIILPPVLRYLLEEYCYSGAVLILGGIMLNVWAAALLFQPVEQHMVRKYKDVEEEEEPPQDILMEEDEDEFYGNEVSHIPRNVTSEKIENGDTPSTIELKNVTKDKTSQSLLPSPSSQNQIRHSNSKRKLSYPRSISKTTYSCASMTIDGAIDGKSKLGSTDHHGWRTSISGPKRNMSTSSFAYVSTTFHGSTLSAFEKPNEFASQFSLKSVTDGVADVAYCCFCCKQRKSDDKGNKFFNISLLKDPVYLIIMISGSTVAISCTNFIILLPFFADNIGFDKAKGAYLLSIVSALDLVGRIGGSTICDLNLVPKCWFFIGGLFFSGVALVIIPFMESYAILSVFCALFGLASGINNAVTTLVMAEFLGVEKLMSSYGISLFVNGLLQLVGPFVCGVWFEHDQNYVNIFVTLGLIFIGGAALWLFMPFVNKRKGDENAPNDRKLVPFIEEENSMEIQNEVLAAPAIVEPEHVNKFSNGSPPIFNKNNFARSISAVQVHNVKAVDRKMAASTSAKNLPTANNLTSAQSFLESVPESRIKTSLEGFGRKLTIPKTPKRSPSTSSFQYMSTPFHGSTLSAFEKPSEFASQFSIKSVTESLAPLACCCRRKKRQDADEPKERSKYFDIQLLKDPIYLVILISNCTCAISYTNFIFLVPWYAEECGFDKSLGAYLLSIISALDLVGRIGGSALSDVVSTPKRYFFIAGLLLSGMSLAAIPLVSTYPAISAFCCVFGIASGINVGVTALVMTEMLGTERLMSSYGISLFVNGIVQLVGPPVCGWFYEYIGSYKPLLVALGFILMFGAALWCFVPFIHRSRRRAQKRNEQMIKT